MEHPADKKTLDELLAEKQLSPAAHTAAVRLLKRSTDWTTWTRRVLLVYGGTLTLIGIIYFFAYNWQEMGKFLKFALVETGTLGCVYFAWRKGFDTTAGRILVTSAAVLIGVLLAVFGQTYQTGADPYGLFLGWAALIFGFVIANRFSGLWILWLALLNIAAILYWQQVARPVYETPYVWLCLGLGVLNSLASTFREIGLLSDLEWLTDTWLRPILLIPGLIALTIPTIDLITSNNVEIINLSATLIWAVVASATYYIYRQFFRDSSILSIVVFDVVIVLLTAIGRVLSEAVGGLTEWTLLFAMVAISVTTAATILLKHEIRSLSSTSDLKPT